MYAPSPSPQMGSRRAGARRTQHPRAIGTIKLDLQDLESKERENMKNFIRSAKRHGTVSAINQYLNISTRGGRKNTNADFGKVSLLDMSNGQILNTNPDKPEDNNYFDNDSDDEPQAEWLEDEFEEIDVGISNSCLINPDGKFKTAWDNIQMLLILYIILVFPFKLSYFKYDTYLIWDIVDYSIDFLFLIDLGFNFFVPFFRNNEFIQTHREIAK